MIINNVVYGFVLFSFLLSEIYLKIRSKCRTNLNEDGNSVSSDSGSISFAFVVAFVAQTTFEIVAVPRLQKENDIYIIKLFFSTFLFFFLVPLIIILNNEQMRKELKRIISFYLFYFFSTSNRSVNLSMNNLIVQ